MQVRLYSIRDKQIGAYLAPFPSRHDVEAMRQIRSSFANPQMRETPIVTHPQDFELHCIGVLDDETGNIVNEGFPSFVIQMAKLASEASNADTLESA